MHGRSRSIVTPGLADLVGVAALVPAGCGRNHLGQGDGAAALVSDASLADAGTDVVDALDASTAQPDLAPFSCASLAPLVAKGVLSSRHARQVRFSPDGRALLLILAGDDSNGDEASVVSLPGGEQHRLRSSDATLLTSGYHGFVGHTWNADRSAFLLARFLPPPAREAELYLADVTDGGAVRLAADLIDHRMFEMHVQSFAIAPSSGRVIYVADTPSDGGRSYGVASVSQRGEDRVWLASNVGTVVVSGFGDRIAVITTERTSTTSTAKVTVLSPTTGSVQFTEQSSSIATVTFVPGDRGQRSRPFGDTAGPAAAVISPDIGAGVAPSPSRTAIRSTCGTGPSSPCSTSAWSRSLSRDHLTPAGGRFLVRALANVIRETAAQR